jgi:hypothetical protein
MSRRTSTRRQLVRVVLYYVVLAAALVALSRLFPQFGAMLRGEQLEALASSDAASRIFGQGAAPAVGEPTANVPGANVVTGVFGMAGALAIMIPVTWIYLLTRGHRGYDESVVHTLLILPVAVAGIVMIVQHSLPIAFSLAGIVAAVRFRTTLKDTKDAVYVFLAIGVGVASGVPALGLALALSLVFNIVILTLWATRFGNPYTLRGTGPGGIGLGETLVGPDASESVEVVGDPALLDAAAPGHIREVLERAARMERHISEERRKKKKSRANALLLVHAEEAGPAQEEVERILDDLTTRHKLAEIVPAGGGVVLEYLARVDGPGVHGAILDQIRKAPRGNIRTAELRSLKGLKTRT